MDGAEPGQWHEGWCGAWFSGSASRSDHMASRKSPGRLLVKAMEAQKSPPPKLVDRTEPAGPVGLDEQRSPSRASLGTFGFVTENVCGPLPDCCTLADRGQCNNPFANACGRVADRGLGTCVDATARRGRAKRRIQTGLGLDRWRWRRLRVHRGRRGGFVRQARPELTARHPAIALCRYPSDI